MSHSDVEVKVPVAPEYIPVPPDTIPDRSGGHRGTPSATGISNRAFKKRIILSSIDIYTDYHTTKYVRTNNMIYPNKRIILAILLAICFISHSSVTAERDRGGEGLKGGDRVRRLSPKSSKQSKSAAVTFTTVHSSNHLVLNEGFSVAGSGEVVDEADHSVVIGSSHFSCIVTSLNDPFVAICDLVGCMGTSSSDDCIVLKARFEIPVADGVPRCPPDLSGIVSGGTGMYSGATGTFTSTSECDMHGKTSEGVHARITTDRTIVYLH